MSFWTTLENLWTSELEPFFGSVAATEVVALKPIVATAITSLETGEIAALAAGGKTTGNVLAKVVAQTVTAAETAGIAAGAGSILAAVGNGVATLPAK